MGCLNEIWKIGGALTDYLVDVCNHALEGEVPKEWVDCTITPIYKKGSPNDPDNYREIALLSTGGKVFSAVLTRRLQRVLVPDVVPESQYGYQPDRSTDDLIYVLRQLFERAREKNTPMYAIFIDFRKAFDSVDGGLLWEVLSLECRQSVSLHSGTCTPIWRGGLPIVESSPQSSPHPHWSKTRITEGPVLFILFLAAIIEVAFPDNSRFRSEMGVKLEVAGGDITDARRFQRPTLIRILDCIYAHDTALVSDSFEDMQEIICQFAQTATKFGLLMSLQTTVSMCFNPAMQENLPVPPFYVGNHPLEDVSSFPYLGSILTPDNDMTEEFDMRIGLARVVFFKLTRRLWNQRGIRKVTKTRGFNAVVSSTLLYGAGTWTRKEQQTKQLENAQYRLARYMLGAKPMDHVRMTRAYEELGMIPLRVLLVRRNLA